MHGQAILAEKILEALIDAGQPDRLHHHTYDHRLCFKVSKKPSNRSIPSFLNNCRSRATTSEIGLGGGEDGVLI